MDSVPKRDHHELMAFFKRTTEPEPTNDDSPIDSAAALDQINSHPDSVQVDGEYGWEGGATTATDHIVELLDSLAEVMAQHGVNLEWGAVSESPELSAEIGGDDVLLLPADFDGRPVLEATMQVLVRANAIAARAGSDRRWWFLATDDAMGIAYFVDPEGHADLVALAAPLYGDDAFWDPEELLAD